MQTTREIADVTVTLGDMRPEDRGGVFASWMDCARQLRQTRMAVFNEYYPHIVEALLDTDRVTVCWRDGSKGWHAWACGQAPNLLHFAYVPAPLRGHGFGRAVIEHVLGGYPKTVFVTSSPLSLPNHPRFVYNPFVLRAA